MSVNTYLYQTLRLWFVALFLSVAAARAEDGGSLETRIARLRADERHLEQLRAELKEDIRKVESKNPEHVVLTGGGLGEGFYVLMLKEQYERRVAVSVLIGRLTFEEAQANIRLVVGTTKAFPQAAKEILSEIEQQLAVTTKELLALLDQRNREGDTTALTGSWAATIEGFGSSTFKFEPLGDNRYNFQQSGLGNASGTAVVTGRRIRINWSTPDKIWVGYIEVDLDETGRAGTGVDVVTKGFRTGTFKTKMRR